MISFQALYERLQTLSTDDDSTTLTFFKALINETQHGILALDDWDFTERSITDTTVASQEAYDIPYNYQKMKRVTVTVGSIAYPVEPIDDQEFWDHLKQRTFKSDIPQYYFIQDNEMKLYPTPSSSGSTITMYYHIIVRDMTADDYTTGNVSDITNGSTTVSGSGTTWTSTMAGRFIRLTSDGYWYQIASVTNSTTLVLEKNYQGTTVSSGSEAYTIGEMPVLPEGYHDLLVSRPMAIYYMEKEELPFSRMYWKRYDGGHELGESDEVRGKLGRLLDERTNKTTSRIISGRGDLYAKIQSRNPNDFPLGLTD